MRAQARTEKSPAAVVSRAAVEMTPWPIPPSEAAPTPSHSSVQMAVAEMQRQQAQHPFWHNPLFRACEEGAVTIDDFRFIFSQYYLYSRNFTRYLSALMANCESDLLRAEMSQNLWEEGGGADPQKRHAQLFRDFLQHALGVAALDKIEFTDFTKLFVREYLDYCLHAEPSAASAFLSLGTEGIVARMYSVFVKGMRKAGIKDEQLIFFHIHMECDDDHAATLEHMMELYVEEPGWFATCIKAMNHALDLRMHFFDAMFRALQEKRVRGVLEGIQARRSLEESGVANAHHCADGGTFVYANEIKKHNIKFTVEKLPVAAQVLDPRLVRIPAGKCNENHRHAHETVFYIIAGKGRVVVGETATHVVAGDVVFVPRWAMHQSHNTGTEEMLILAVTDFGLTGRVFLGDYDKTARLKRS